MIAYTFQRDEEMDHTALHRPDNANKQDIRPQSDRTTRHEPHLESWSNKPLVGRVSSINLCLENHQLRSIFLRLRFWHLPHHLLLLVMLALPGVAMATTPLEIGIWPYMSTQSLITLYRPLQKFLSAELHQPVIFVTAPNQITFARRMLADDYLFVLSAPHFARMAELESGYVPFLRAKRDLDSIFIVARNNPIASLQGLRGQTITLPENVTVVAMLSLQKLKASGLLPERDIQVKYAMSHNSAALDVLRGNSAAAATTTTILDQMPDKNRFRILADAGNAAPVIISASPKATASQITQMKQLLLDFCNNDPIGKRFTQTVGWQGLRSTSPNELQRMDPLVRDLHQLMDPQ